MNNVGIAYDGILATQGERSIAEIVQVNLTSTLVLTKHYIRRRLKQGGRIVSVSSIIGIREATRGSPPTARPRPASTG